VQRGALIADERAHLRDELGLHGLIGKEEAGHGDYNQEQAPKRS
jgi:hypothetical protein